MKAKDFKKTIHSFLKNCTLMVLATSSADGQPRANALVFHADEDLNFYFVTREGSQKTINIAENDQVALSISFEPPYNIEASGRAEVVTDSSVHEMVMDRFVEKVVKLPELWPPIFRYSDGEYMVYRIRPNNVRVLDMTEQHIYESEPPFTSLV